MPDGATATLRLAWRTRRGEPDEFGGAATAACRPGLQKADQQFGSICDRIGQVHLLPLDGAPHQATARGQVLRIDRGRNDRGQQGWREFLRSPRGGSKTCAARANRKDRPLLARTSVRSPSFSRQWRAKVRLSYVWICREQIGSGRPSKNYTVSGALRPAEQCPGCRVSGIIERLSLPEWSVRHSCAGSVEIGSWNMGFPPSGGAVLEKTKNQ